MTLINTKENISGLALAYFDEVIEELVEITSENLYFSLFPYATEHKRLYVIGDAIYSDLVQITTNYDRSQYDVRIEVFKEYQYEKDFENSRDNLFCTLDNKHLNSIPVDFLIRSKTTSSTSFNLEITLQTGEIPK